MAKKESGLEKKVNKVHKIRLHHFDSWYDEIYDPPIEEDTQEALEIYKSGREYNYNTFNNIPTPALLNLSLDDYVLVVQNKDDVCSKCPEPERDCCKFDEHYPLTRSIGLKVGEKYQVKDVLQKFAEYNHKGEKKG